MFRYLIVEWLKIKKVKHLWFFSVSPAVISVTIAYMIGNGITLNTSHTAEYASWELWKASTSLLFITVQIVFLLFIGLFLINWQSKEHKDGTFKFYEVTPIDTFVAVQIRFYLFYILYAVLMFITLLLSLYLMQNSLIAKNPDHAEYLKISGFILSYLYGAVKAMLILSIPSYFFLFIFSIKVKSATVSTVVLIMLCILGLLNVPNWLFFRSMQSSLAMLRNIYSVGSVYTINDLQSVYFWNILSFLGFLVCTYYLIQKGQFFDKAYEKI